MESDLRQCKKCLQLKRRILVGKFDTKNKKFHDENAKTWSGNVCPECHKNRIKDNMKSLREKRKGPGNEEPSSS